MARRSGCVSAGRAMPAIPARPATLLPRVGFNYISSPPEICEKSDHLDWTDDWRQSWIAGKERWTRPAETIRRKKSVDLQRVAGAALVIPFGLARRDLDGGDDSVVTLMGLSVAVSVAEHSLSLADRLAGRNGACGRSGRMGEPLPGVAVDGWKHRGGWDASGESSGQMRGDVVLVLG